MGKDGKFLFNEYKDSVSDDDENVLEIQIVVTIANDVDTLNATEIDIYNG